MEVYPNAKVVLTVRDPEAWYKSVKETIHLINVNKNSLSMFPSDKNTGIELAALDEIVDIHIINQGLQSSSVSITHIFPQLVSNLVPLQMLYKKLVTIDLTRNIL